MLMTQKLFIYCFCLFCSGLQGLDAIPACIGTDAVSWFFRYMRALCVLTFTKLHFDSPHFCSDSHLHRMTSHLDPRWLPGLAQRPITAQSFVAVWDSSNQPEGGREETQRRRKLLTLRGASGACSLFTCKQNNGRK